MMNKRIVAATLLASIFAGPAFAADMPVKAVAKAPVVMVAPPALWTGCYVGINGGYGWGGDEVSSGGVNEGNPNFKGGLGGGQIGCDYQFAGPVVIGIAAMYDFASLKGDAIDPANTAATTSSHYKSIGVASARIGYAFDRSLLYVMGGFARSTSERTIVGPGFSQSTGDTTKTGYVLGGGWEYLFAPNWSAKLEYNHFAFGDFNEFVVQLPGGAVFLQGDRNRSIDVLLFGINYRFAH